MGRHSSKQKPMRRPASPQEHTPRPAGHGGHAHWGPDQYSHVRKHTRAAGEIWKGEAVIMLQTTLIVYRENANNLWANS